MKFKTKLAKRLLIIAVVFFVLVGGAGSFYIVRKANIRAEMGRARVDGLKAFAEGDNQRAVDLLGKYIAHTSKPADDAMIAYARSRPLLPLPQNEHLRQSIFVLRTLLKDRPQSELVEQRRELLDLYVKTQFWVEARTMADNLLPKDMPTKPGDAPIWAARTKSAYALGNFDDATGYARQWLALDPHNLEGQIMLLELARRTGKYGDKTDKSANTIELAERLIADTYPDRPATAPSTRTQLAARDALLRGYALFMYADTDQESQRKHRLEAARQLHAAIDFVFPDRALTEMFIGVLDQLHMVDDSVAVLRRLDADTSDPTARAAVHSRLARRLWEADDFKSAAALLADLDIPTASTELLAIDALSELALGNQARANAVLSALSSRSRPDSPNPSADAWAAVVRSAISPKSAEPVRIAALCERALDVEKNPYLAFILGRLNLEQKDPDAALRHWKSSAQWSVTWARPLIYMAPLLSQTGQHQAAIAAASEGATRAPHSVPAALTYFSVMDAAVDAGAVADTAGVLAQIDQGLTPTFKDSDVLLCLRVNLLAASGKSREANEAVKTRVASTQPVTEQALTRLLVIAQKRHLPDVESLCRAEIEKNFAQSPRIASARAEKLIAAGKSTEALHAFEQVRAGAPDSQSLAWRFAWARCLDRAADPRAKDAVIELADAQPADLNVQLFAGDARATSADRDFLQRVLAHVHDLAGEGTAWRLLNARNLLRFAPEPQHPDIDKAMELLQQALTASPSSLDARLLLADALEKRGRDSEALVQVKAAVGEQPDSPELLLQYARLLHRAGDDESARDQLARIAKLPTVPRQARIGAAAVAAEARDAHLALALLADVKAATPAEFLLLAEVNWMNNRLPEAEAAYQKILESHDAEPEAVESAAEFYFSRSNPSTVTILLDRLAAEKQYAGRAQYQLGRYSQKLYGPAKAVAHYRLAVAGDPTLAAAWSELIGAQLALGQTRDAAKTIRDAAKAVPGDPHLAALNQNIEWFSLWDSVPDLRQLLQDYAQGRDTQAPWLKEIIDDYKAGKSRPDLARKTDSLVVAYPKVQPLYNYAMDLRIGLGRWPEVTNWAARAAAAFPASLQPQVILVRMLELQKKWPQVLSEARKWRENSGAFLLPADLAIANAYVQIGRPRDAVNQLSRYVNDPGHFRELYLTVLPSYAAAVRRSGTADVSSIMEPLLKADPARRANYIRFAITELKDDPARAAAWLDHAAQAVPQGAVEEQLALATAWRELYAVSPQKHNEFLARACAIAEPLTAGKEPNLAALLNLALSQEYLDSKAADSSYRRLITLAPQGSVPQVYAQNNLAMLIAKTGGDLNEAANLAHSALKLQPKNGAVNDTLAFVEIKRGKLNDALPPAQVALDADPRKVQFIVRVAEILTALGQPANAQKVLKTIDELEIDLTGETDDVKKQLSDVQASIGNLLKQSETKPG